MHTQWWRTLHQRSNVQHFFLWDRTINSWTTFGFWYQRRKTKTVLGKPAGWLCPYRWLCQLLSGTRPHSAKNIWLTTHFMRLFRSQTSRTDQYESSCAPKSLLYQLAPGPQGIKPGLWTWMQHKTAAIQLLEVSISPSACGCCAEWCSCPSLTPEQPRGTQHWEQPVLVLDQPWRWWPGWSICPFNCSPVLLSGQNKWVSKWRTANSGGTDYRNLFLIFLMCLVTSSISARC